MQTRAVRSAIGKAVIGDDSAASSGRAAKPATASGAVNGHNPEAHRPPGPDASARGDSSLFSLQHPAAQERESNRLGLPGSSGSSPNSPQSARSATSRGRNTSPFGSLASSDSDRLRVSGCSGAPHKADSSINGASGACQGSGSGSDSLLDGLATPAASKSIGGTSSNLGSLAGEGRDATGSPAQFSDQAEQAPEEGGHIGSRPDAGGSTNRSGSLSHPQSGLLTSLFGEPDLHSSTAQDPAAGQGGRSVLPVQRMQSGSLFGCQ